MRSIGRGFIAAILGLSFVVGGGTPATHAQTSTQTSANFAAMCDAIRVLDGRDSIRLGVVVQDLQSGERCEVRANESFRSASLYKLVVLAEAERQASVGLLTFDDTLLVEPRHAIDDPPELRPTFSFERSFAEAIQRMIQSSSNADARALRETLGVDQVDAFPAAIGMESTHLGNDFVTTPDDIATYFAQLYRGELVTEEASASMLATLKGQLLRDLIPEPLPENVAIAHKTGTLADHLHDAGIVFAPGGDYVLVAMSQHPFAEGAATDLLRDVSARVFRSYAVAADALPLPPPALEQTESAPEITAAIIAGFEAGREAARVEAGAGEGAGADSVASGEGAATPDSGFSLPGIPGLDLRVATLGAISISILAALLGVFTYGSWLRRSRSDGYNRGAVDAVAGRGEGTANMRLGIRNTDEDNLTEGSEALVPASESFVEIEAQPVMPSARLERMAEFFASQQHLLESIRQQYQDEVQPLNALLGRQSGTQQRLLTNLERRLRPLNEYADGEEANLDALEQRMSEQGPDFIQRSFSEYLEAQRSRIADTRDQIDAQRLPLLRYGEEQRDAVEVALSRFDADVEALELNLAEQRKLLMRMLDAMRSDSFVAVKRFLETREETMAQLAETGITDPAQIGSSAQNLREAVDAMASQSVHIQAVLETTDEADERLVSSAPTTGPHALPDRGTFEDALAELEAVEAEETLAGA